MSISWIIIVFTSYSRDNLPIGLQYITIQLVCNKREYKFYVCIYNSHLTSNDTGPDVKASEQQDTMKNLGHRKKSNEWQNVICLQSSNLVQIEGCSDAILTTRVKTGWYSVSKWVRLHSGFGRVIVFGVWIYCVWMDESVWNLEPGS